MTQASSSRPLVPASASAAADPVALCVDLDGTLLKTDLLFESLLALARSQFWALLLVPVWWWRGKTRLKHELARRVVPDPSILPYRQEVLEWLGLERAAGRRLVLVTGSHERLARAVADHLGLFDEVIATDLTRNVVGVTKRDVLVERLGPSGFDYAGDARVDLPVWAAARSAIVVAAPRRVERAAGAQGNAVRFFARTPVGIRTVVRAIRSHQWAKNVLLFVPLLAAHRVGFEWVRTSVGVVAFSLCASAVYLGNDLLDLDSDRRHRSKRERPFASGALPLGWGFVGAPLLLAASFAIGFLVSADFVLILALYLALTTAYTLVLKRLAIVDVLCLATLYSLRIFAGGTAAGLAVSDWLIAFSMFFFLSLALVKRAAELRSTEVAGLSDALHGRGYAVGDLPIITQMGVAAGQLSVLVFAVYIQSDTVRELYSAPWALWFVCPLIFLWLARVWLLTSRGQMHDDPVVFAIRDRTSYAVALAAGATLWLAH